MIYLSSRHWHSSQPLSPHLSDNFFRVAVSAISNALAKENVLRASVLFAFAAIGYFCGIKYYYCFCLLDVAFSNEIMRNLLKAIVKPAKQLAYTLFLILIVLYTFGVSAYFLFEKSYLSFNLESFSSDVVSFFFVTVYNIMVPGPTLSIGDEGEFWDRFGFDILFYVVLDVIMLNIVFGIIIDTFGALRDETNTRNDHLKHYCFICNLSTKEIEHASQRVTNRGEKFGSGEDARDRSLKDQNNNSDSDSGAGGSSSGAFAEHCETDHSQWAYMHFLFFVLSKDSTTFTGPEQYVSDMLKNDDLGFFPIERSLVIDEVRKMGEAKKEE